MSGSDLVPDGRISFWFAQSAVEALAVLQPAVAVQVDDGRWGKERFYSTEMTSLVQSYVPVPATMEGNMHAGPVVVAKAASAAPTPRSHVRPGAIRTTAVDPAAALRGSKRKASFDPWDEACQPFHANCPYTDEILCQCPFGAAADVAQVDTAILATDIGLFPER